jgi:hypothetical protein
LLLATKNLKDNLISSLGLEAHKFAIENEVSNFLYFHHALNALATQIQNEYYVDIHQPSNSPTHEGQDP